MTLYDRIFVFWQNDFWFYAFGRHVITVANDKNKKTRLNWETGQTHKGLSPQYK
jgi:hypothetical protein